QDCGIQETPTHGSRRGRPRGQHRPGGIQDDIISELGGEMRGEKVSRAFGFTFSVRVAAPPRGIQRTLNVNAAWRYSLDAGSKTLQRGMGVWQATALNITMIVGAGVFVTIPLMLKELPGPYALLGWIVAGALILVDGLIWSELSAALPASGGSHQFLLESYGR